jgi:hemoglobin
MQANQPHSLYVRLGGYDRLLTVLDHVCARLVKDAQLGLFFKGHNNLGKRRLRQMFVDYLCERAGGPVYYNGLGMKEAHEGLGISKGDWDVALRHFNEVFDMYKVTGAEREEMLAIIAGLKGDIVEEPKG